MKNHKSRRCFWLIMLFSTSLFGAESISGKWTWTTKTPNGNSISSILHAKQNQNEFTGYLSRPERDGKLEIQNGKLDGDQVSFVVTPIYEGNKITIRYRGTLKGDKIQGKLRVEEFDADLDWQASRVQSIDPSGKWHWSLVLPDGNKMEASLELSLNGEKLAGELISEDWAVALLDTKISGKHISFKTRNENNGQEYFSKGSIEGKKISGKVSFTDENGEKQTFEWIAKKTNPEE